MHETRNLNGRTVLASNSVLFVASAQAGAAGQLDAFATELVARGCTIHSQSAESVAIYRFETFVTPLLSVAHAAMEGKALAVSATMAVKVVVDGRPMPSPKSVDIGVTLAREARPGMLVLSLRLASLLSATEPECSGLLHTAGVRMADGRKRAVVRFDDAKDAGPVSSGGMGQVVGRLPREIADRLVQRIYQRVSVTVPDISERAVRHAVTARDSAVAIAKDLTRQAPRESHATIRLIVDDEVRWIRLRREPSNASNP
jgi:hypothetical protein